MPLTLGQASRVGSRPQPDFEMIMTGPSGEVTDLSDIASWHMSSFSPTGQGTYEGLKLDLLNRTNEGGLNFLSRRHAVFEGASQSDKKMTFSTSHSALCISRMRQVVANQIKLFCMH
jgi:hypothetical protein